VIDGWVMVYLMTFVKGFIIDGEFKRGLLESPLMKFSSKTYRPFDLRVSIENLISLLRLHQLLGAAKFTLTICQIIYGNLIDFRGPA
jgi:hypothetical protein